MIAYNPSVIWIFQKNSTCRSGKLRTKITSLIAKSNSPELSDMTFFARCYSEFQNLLFHILRRKAWPSQCSTYCCRCCRSFTIFKNSFPQDENEVYLQLHIYKSEVQALLGEGRGIRLSLVWIPKHFYKCNILRRKEWPCWYCTYSCLCRCQSFKIF